MSELARRYALALYGNTQEEDALHRTAKALTGCAPLWEALLNPLVRPEEKKAVLGRLPELSGAPELRRFYALLAEKGRMALLPSIAEEYHALALEARGACTCVLRCVHPPDERRQAQIKKLLMEKHHKREVLLDIREDPTLLGGFVLEIEGVTYDKSVSGGLRDLARQLEERRRL